jgi:hypothetical protein
MRFTKDELKGFSDAAQSLKLYRRAELIDEQSGKQIINELYVDPLPEDAVLTAILKPNTTFLIGRKGTGKSTIFQRAQAEIRGRKGAVSTYVDIKTTFEESQVDTSVLQKLPAETLVMAQPAVEKLLLYRGFLVSVLTGMRDQLKRKLRESFWAQLKESFTGTIEELFEDFDSLIEEAHADKFVDVLAAKKLEVKDRESQKQAADASGAIGVGSHGPELKLKGGASAEQFAEDVRKYAAQRGLTDAEAIEEGLKQKATEFNEAGAEIYAKT